jgi:hypothetical protein
MGFQSRIPAPNRFPIPKWLVAPLFAISMAAHVVLLVVPLPSRQTPPEPEEAAPEGPIAIDILGIARPETPELLGAEPPPAAETPAAAQPTPQQAAPVPVNPDTLPPANENPVEETPTAAPDPFQEEVVAPSPPETPAFDPTPFRQQFFTSLPNIGVSDYTDTIGLPSPSNFRNPGIASRFLANADRNPSALPNTTARWLDKEPATILRDGLEATYGAAGLRFDEQPPFEGERFFEVRNAEGQTVFYVSLVQLQGSTLLVMWDNDPR